MRNLNPSEIAKVIGILNYHVELPRLKEGIRATITLRELLNKESTFLEGLTLDMVCAYGTRGLNILEKVLEDSITDGSTVQQWKDKAAEVTNNLRMKYGKEGEKWVTR